MRPGLVFDQAGAGASRGSAGYLERCGSCGGSGRATSAPSRALVAAVGRGDDAGHDGCSATPLIVSGADRPAGSVGRIGTSSAWQSARMRLARFGIRASARSVPSSARSSWRDRLIFRVSERVSIVSFTWRARTGVSAQSMPDHETIGLERLYRPMEDEAHTHGGNKKANNACGRVDPPLANAAQHYPGAP
jgi:hypothetical protein